MNIQIKKIRILQLNAQIALKKLKLLLNQLMEVLCIAMLVLNLNEVITNDALF